ncbi:hypothetical protein ACP4OV_012936 [Aristida adscensionis]
MCGGSSTNGASSPPPSISSPPHELFIVLAVCMVVVSFTVLLATAFVFCCRRSRDAGAAGSEQAPCGARRGETFPVDALLPAVAFACHSGDDEEHGGRRECAVCLGAVREGDMVRRLPACLHVYHVECIDRWLAAHRTCPLCRAGLGSCVVGSGLTGTVEPAVQDDPPDQQLV